MKILIADNQERSKKIKDILMREEFSDLEIYDTEYFSLDNEIDFCKFHMLLINLEENSFENIKLLREAQKCKNIYIIAIIKEINMNIVNELINLQIDDYIEVPIKEETLLFKFKTVIRNNEKFEENNDKCENYKHIIERYNLDKEDLEKDILLAKQIQNSILSQPLDDENLKIDIKYVPCSNLAGDFYCWYKIDEYRYGIIIIDVMGHGIASALVGMSLRSLLRGMIIRLSDPLKVINELNQHMNNLYYDSELDEILYFTAIYLLIDCKNKNIEYVNAGHPSGIAISKEGEINKLNEGSIAIGLMPQMPIKKGVFKYEDTLRIVLFTDGIFAISNESPSKEMDDIEGFFKNDKSIEDYYLSRKSNMQDKNAATLNDDICIIDINIK